MQDEYVLWKVAPRSPFKFVFDWQLCVALTRDARNGLAELRNTRRTSAQNRVARLRVVQCSWKEGFPMGYRTVHGQQSQQLFLTLLALRTTTVITRAKIQSHSNVPRAPFTELAKVQCPDSYIVQMIPMDPTPIIAPVMT